jgi:flagellin-like protein
MNALKLFLEMKTAAYKAFTSEKGEVNVVAMVLLIVIAVALAILFQGQITNFLNTQFGKINDKANQFI